MFLFLQPAHLDVPVDQPVQLEVIVILAERVDQGLGNLWQVVRAGQMGWTFLHV